MQRTVALLTPSHSKDIDRLKLLCDSIDRHVMGHERHYIIVNDSDVSMFAEFKSDRRVVLPSSQFLPKWLRLLPLFLVRSGRRIWWSFRSRPVHGWHVQQILKIAAAVQLPEQRFCIIDSDNVFFREFDVGAYAGGEKTPLYVDRNAILATAPLHAVWTRSCDRLLNQAETGFPADDYVGNVIVWDKSTVTDMTLAVEAAAKRSWQEALCRTRVFSEYLLYGHFVRNSATHLVAHEIRTEGLACAYWDATPLGAEAVAAMVKDAPTSKVALCIQSYSNTPVSVVREAVDLVCCGANGRFSAITA
ncbi:MAG: hypothetical protein JO107_15400 [Hyphomicrobiales bacterium]|nr:hypothetical protein [Hyphomicrobiales bacterium]